MMPGSAKHSGGEISDAGQMAAEMATRLFGDLFWPDNVRAGGDGAWTPQKWDAVEATGLPLALVPEKFGGYGLPQREALELIRIAGGAAAPLPFAETLVANWLLAVAGLPLPGGPLTFALAAEGLEATPKGSGLRLSGRVARVPWGGVADHVVVLATTEDTLRVVLLSRSDYRVSQQLTNQAGEPRDTLEFDCTVEANQIGEHTLNINVQDVLGCGAAIRTIAIAGALEAALQRCVTYVMERTQFGKPIGKFQAIQHQMAVMAGHLAMASAAAQLAADSFGDSRRRTKVAAAKVVADEAAGSGAAIAHQLHGAIGFTREHPLHLFTMRLWSWRDEYGSAQCWSRQLGEAALAAGKDGLWPFVTAERAQLCRC